MIFIELLLAFLQVGLFSFGGAYGAIPLIQDTVLSHGWLSEDMIKYFIAVAESTPGSIMVNLATYIGSNQGGIIGAALATIGVVIPSFLIIFLFVKFSDKVFNKPFIQAILDGIKPCIIGIIFASGITMLYGNLFPSDSISEFDLYALIITVVLIAVSVVWQKIKKKSMSPIALIIVSAVLGIIIYGI